MSVSVAMARGWPFTRGSFMAAWLGAFSLSMWSPFACGHLVAQTALAPQAASLPDIVQLSESGYKAVVKLHDNFAMQVFVERLVKSMGKRVIDQSAMHGWLPFFSGVVAEQSFDHMYQELMEAKWLNAQPNATTPPAKKVNLLRKASNVTALAAKASKAAKGTNATQNPSVVLPLSFVGETADMVFNDFANKTKTMQEQVAATQREARARLSKQKQAYEAGLRSQRLEIDKVEAASKSIAEDVRRANRRAEKLKAEAEAILQANDLLRESLVNLLHRVDFAVEFLAVSMNDTADLGADGLEQLLAPKRDLEYYINEARRDLHSGNNGTSTGRSVSLLAVASGSLLAGNTEEQGALLESLSHTLERVERATLEGVAKLKASYLSASEKLSKEKAAATRKQVELLEEKTKAENTMQTMTRAVNFLRDVHYTFEQRMSAIQTFMGKLQAGVEAVLLQAEHLKDGVQ